MQNGTNNTPPPNEEEDELIQLFRRYVNKPDTDLESITLGVNASEQVREILEEAKARVLAEARAREKERNEPKQYKYL